MYQGFIIKWYHVFTNAFFLIRRRIYTILAKEAKTLSGSVMDFGCGNKPYEALFVHVDKYIGLDIEESGNSGLKKADVYYDGKNIPFSDNYFDNIFCSEVFEHVFNLEEIIPEMNRVLKPGGKMLITCPFTWPEHEVPYDYARYTSYGIKHLLEKNGFTVERQYKSGHMFEVIMQQFIFYIFCLIPKQKLVYYILHQLLILPGIIFTLIINKLLFGKLIRKELYHNNVIVVTKNN